MRKPAGEARRWLGRGKLNDSFWTASSEKGDGRQKPAGELEMAKGSMQGWEGGQRDEASDPGSS